MNRTLPHTIAAHSEQCIRTSGKEGIQGGGLKVLAGAVLEKASFCANVRTLGNAQSHITPEDRALPRTIAAHRASDAHFFEQQADEIAHALIERLCVAWDCPQGEFDELQLLHRQGKLTLEYIELLIQDAPREPE